MAKIFGGSASKSQQSSQSTSSSSNASGNYAYPFMKNEFGTTGATAYRNGVLTLNDELGGGYDKYKQNTGFDFFRALGLDRLASQGSGKGVFQSGSTLKGLANYQNQIGNASYNDYLQQQGALAGLGTQGGALTAQTGGWSEGESQAQSTSQGTSKSKTYAGMGKFIGDILAASDERLKTDIRQLGEHEGLGVYQYNYINGAGPFIGYMAQEVARKYPEAMGPERSGYLTVNYSKLAEMIGEPS